MVSRRLKGSTAKMVFYAAVLIILCVIAYYVYQTYMWFGKFGGLVDGDVPEDTEDLKDWVIQLNELIQKFMKQFMGK